MIARIRTKSQPFQSPPPPPSPTHTHRADYEVRFWDFNGMDKHLKSFRTVEPFEAHPITGVAYSLTGDKILVTSGKAQAKVCVRSYWFYLGVHVLFVFRCSFLPFKVLVLILCAWCRTFPDTVHDFLALRRPFSLSHWIACYLIL